MARANAKPRSAIKDVVSREYTVNLHKVSTSFSTISWFLEGILMEDIDDKVSPDSKLQISFMFYTRIRSREWVIFKTPLKQTSNPYKNHDNPN